MLFIGMSSLSAKPDQKLTIRSHKGTLSEFFKEIEKQSDYRFFYNDKLVSIEKEVYQLDVNDKTVDEVLTSLLANTGLRYKKLENNLIVISTLELLENVNVTGSVTEAGGEPVIGANVAVKGTTIGTITNAEGNFTLSVPNNDAILVISYIGYATQEIKVGAQRNFPIVLQEDNLILDEVVVVAYGTTKKKDLTGSVSTVDTRSITAQANSSVTSVLEGAVAGLQVQAYEGQPGLDMKIRVRGLGSTNEASSYALVVIDGVPAQMDNALTTINPNDIASVTVLKDAASTALYGSRGANGVVMVTTKKGLSGKAKITFDARWGMNTMTNNMSDLVRDPAAIYEHMWLLNYNTYRYADGKPYQTNGYTIDVQNPMHTHEEAALFASQHLFNYTGNSEKLTRNDLGNWMLYSFPGWNDPSNYEVTGSGADGSSTMLNNFLVGTDGKLNPQARLMYNDTYYDALLSSRFRQEYNVAASGGNDKMDYHVSLGLLNDPSYLSISKFDRYTGRAVINGKVNDWFKVGANVGYTNRLTSGQTARYGSETGLLQNRGDAQENIFTIVNGAMPIVQVYARDENGNYVLNADGSKKTIVQNGDSYSPLGQTSAAVNSNDVLYRLENDKAEVISHDLTARTYAEAKFLNDFTFTANLATDASFSNATNYRNGIIGRASASKGQLYTQKNTYVNLNTQQLLNWNRNFGKHHADALLGHEYNQYTLDIMRYSASHELIPGYTGYANFVGRYITGIGYPVPGGDQSKFTMESYFTRANYIYDDKYGVSASLRRDGSSKFKYAEDRWGTFWSVGGSWRLSSEKFIQESAAADWLNNLKLRASYGVIGNQNGIGTYAGYQTWAYGATYVETTNGTGTPASYTVNPGSVVNEHLTWENVHTTDIGVEFDLFNCVHGVFDWYNRETVNAFYPNAMSIAAEAFAGTTSITIDNAGIRNRGFEVDLSVDILRSKDLYWSVGLNGTHYNTILTKLPPGQGSDAFGGNTVYGNDYVCYLRGEGKPFYNVFMYKYEGPDPTSGVPLYRHTVTEADKPEMINGELVGTDHFPDNKVGDVIKTANYTRVTSLDRVEIGDALPDWIGGFNTTFRYKNLDFSSALSYQIGGLYHHRELIYSYESDFARDAARPIESELIGNTWTPDNPNAKFPIAVHNKTNASAFGIAVLGPGPQQTTDLLLFGASYFNVKNITLGYNLPVNWARRAGLSKLRVYASADNLYMLSEHKGVDPRMSLTGGNDVGQYPYPYLRVFNAGVNIEF
jgi:TonB-linked SusC/RagA family outer membrane protein